MEISLTDQRRPGESESTKFRYPGGARDFVVLLDEQGEAPASTDIIGFECEDPQIAGTVEVAFR